MRSNFSKQAGRDRFERLEWQCGSSLFLAAIISLTIAVPLAFAQGSGQAQGAAGADTVNGAGAPETSGQFRRKARFMQSETGAGEGENADLRARMRRAIKARQMEGADGPDGQQEPLAPGEGAGMGRKWRAQMMQNGGFGRRPGEMGRRGGFRGGRRTLDLSPLNLTDEQKTKIQKMRQQASPRARELRSKLLTGGQELKDMMFDPSVSDDSIRAKSRELRKLHDQAEDMKLDNFLSIRSVLTPEQRKRLPEVKPQGPRSAMAGGRRGPGDLAPDAEMKQE